MVFYFPSPFSHRPSHFCNVFMLLQQMTCDLKSFQKRVFRFHLSKCNSNTIRFQNFTHSVKFKLHPCKEYSVISPFTECKVFSFFIKSRGCQANYLCSLIKMKKTQIIRIKSFNYFVQCDNFSLWLKIKMEGFLNNIFLNCTWKCVLVPFAKSLS